MAVTQDTGVLGRPTAGRPRNDALDGPILRTVRQLLSERGYQDLSVQEVTRRCGVHVRTISRRWPTKAELVAAAVLGGDEAKVLGDDRAQRPTGDLRADLRRLVEGSVRYLGDPAIRAAMPALLSDMRTNERVAQRIHRRQQELAATIQSVLQAAVRSGGAPERVLRRRTLLPNLMTGAAFSIQTEQMVVVDDALVDELTDLLVAAVLG
jgi:AcrR family transcriptional regulator